MKSLANLMIIAAVGKNLELGYKNDLIWKIKEDLSFFKEATMDRYIIMGTKTYHSLPKKLPVRKYVVLSDELEPSDDYILCKNLDELLKFIKDTPEMMYVVGGGIIYKLLMPYSAGMLLTEIDEAFPAADTYFPKLNMSEWEKIEGKPQSEGDIKYARNLYARKAD